VSAPSQVHDENTIKSSKALIGNSDVDIGLPDIGFACDLSDHIFLIHSPLRGARPRGRAEPAIYFYRRSQRQQRRVRRSECSIALSAAASPAGVGREWRAVKPIVRPALKNVECGGSTPLCTGRLDGPLCIQTHPERIFVASSLAKRAASSDAALRGSRGSEAGEP
jgi:hypothetical protein